VPEIHRDDCPSIEEEPLINSIADRLLGLVAPKVTARAACQPSTRTFVRCVGITMFRYTCHLLASCDERCTRVRIGLCP